VAHFTGTGLGFKHGLWLDSVANMACEAQMLHLGASFSSFSLLLLLFLKFVYFILAFI
jgi:flagellar biosynthesis protein FliR